MMMVELVVRCCFVWLQVDVCGFQLASKTRFRSAFEAVQLLTKVRLILFTILLFQFTPDPSTSIYFPFLSSSSSFPPPPPPLPPSHASSLFFTLLGFMVYSLFYYYIWFIFYFASQIGRAHV